MLNIFLWIFAIYGIYRLISDSIGGSARPKYRKENTYDKFN